MKDHIHFHKWDAWECGLSSFGLLCRVPFGETKNMFYPSSQRYPYSGDGGQQVADRQWSVKLDDASGHLWGGQQVVVGKRWLKSWKLSGSNLDMTEYPTFPPGVNLRLSPVLFSQNARMWYLRKYQIARIFGTPGTFMGILADSRK
jgi:hypothetical protein